MRILGIDPGTRLTGYGCLDMVDGGHEPTLVEAGVLRLDADAPMATRLAQLFDDLTEVCEDLRPSLVVVEQLFTHARHQRTSILMGHARGVVLLAAQRLGIALDELAPAEVKKSITGHGRASKSQMQMVVQTQLGLPEPPNPPDVADAIAIALCAARRLPSVA